MTWPAERFVVAQDQDVRGLVVIDQGSVTTRSYREKRSEQLGEAGVPNCSVFELVPVEAMDRIRRAAALLAHATEFGGAALSAWETLPDEVKP